jgi:hypothetical protein
MYERQFIEHHRRSLVTDPDAHLKPEPPNGSISNYPDICGVLPQGAWLGASAALGMVEVPTPADCGIHQNGKR